MKGYSPKIICCRRCDKEFLRCVSSERYCAPCKPLALKETTQRADQAFRARNKDTKEYRDARTRRQKLYRDANPEKCREAVKKSRKDSPESRRAYLQQWRKENAADISAKRKATYQANRQSILENQKTDAARASRRSYEQKRRITDPVFRLNGRMTANIRQSLKTNKAGRNWEALVGYTLQELVRHLERQFLKGMSWENIGEWHIDHIIPKSSFVYESAECDGFKAAWAITNLRPLWAADNIRKHAHVMHLI